MKKASAPVERRVKAVYSEMDMGRVEHIISYGTVRGNWFYSDDGDKKYVKGKYFHILCEEKDFGINYIIGGLFEKDKKVDTQIEGVNYCNREVHINSNGLYVTINKKKIYKDECIENRKSWYWIY